MEFNKLNSKVQLQTPQLPPDIINYILQLTQRLLYNDVVREFKNILFKCRSQLVNNSSVRHVPKRYIYLNCNNEVYYIPVVLIWPWINQQWGYIRLERPIHDQSSMWYEYLEVRTLVHKYNCIV